MHVLQKQQIHTIKSYKNNKFNTLGPAGKKIFESTNGSHFVSEIQDYFEYITKKNENLTDNPPIRIYVNEVDNRITFKFKKEILELLTHEI